MIAKLVRLILTVLKILKTSQEHTRGGVLMLVKLQAFTPQFN